MWKWIIALGSTYVGLPIFIGYRIEKRKEYPRDH